MNMATRVATGRFTGALAVLFAGSLLLQAGCGGGWHERRAERRAERRTSRAPRLAANVRPITLDGATAEWPDNVAAMGDADHLYFRVALPEEITLQASPEPVTMLVDLDGNAGTGMTLSTPRVAAGHGFDLGVQFSPQDGRGGVSVFALDPGGAHQPVPHDHVGLQFAPTHAAGVFEVRIARHASAQAPAGVASALAQAGPSSWMVTLQDAEGKTVGWADPESFTRPARSPSAPLADAALPAKSEGAVRVVSWNVKRSGPMTNAGPFSHVLQALDADVILVQEWDDADAATLQAWFTAVVSGEKTWAARTGEGRGVAIVAPHPIKPAGATRLVVSEGGSEAGEPVRWIAGVVQTPVGDVAVASIHLKCCGGSGTPEDQRRLAEAQVINAAMGEAFGEAGAALRVIGGDFNLVGTRGPLDMLARGLDTDASDLAPANPTVLGDSTLVTWADATTQFTPGRLDYVLYGDGGAQVVQAFVLDTTRLSDGALARIGLDRSDTEASDHRPVVIDLRLR